MRTKSEYNALTISFRNNVVLDNQTIWNMGKRYPILFISKNDKDAKCLRIEVKSEDEHGNVIILSQGEQESIWTGFKDNKGNKVSYDIWSKEKKVHWDFLRSLIN